MGNKPTVAIAMSGGVDSSVAAALLVEQGYSVIGIMLNLWSEQDSYKSNRCCTPDSVALARRVAAVLSIPFYVLDARQIFFDSVVKPFIDDYTQNLTPNPCVSCNRFIRWDFLFNHALSAGAEFLATGHYARVSKKSNGTFQLLKGVDSIKDQSYVLHVLTQKKLNQALFPLGDYIKQDVRKMAQEFSLPVATRPDSQDLCFIGGDGDYRQFLARHAPEPQIPGFIRDLEGKYLGEHQGLAYFTIGQRKGLNIASPTPLYVIAKDITKNELIVGDHKQSAKGFLIAEEMNWIEGQPPVYKDDLSVKIRYRAREIPCTIHAIDPSTIRIEFNCPIIDITPGQAAVIYNGDICLGGGIISLDRS